MIEKLLSIQTFVHLLERRKFKNATQHFSEFKLQGDIILLFSHFMFLNMLAAHLNMVRKVVYNVQLRMIQIMNSVQEQLLYWLAPNTISKLFFSCWLQLLCFVGVFCVHCFEKISKELLLERLDGILEMLHKDHCIC